MTCRSLADHLRRARRGACAEAAAHCQMTIPTAVPSERPDPTGPVADE